MFKYAIIGFGGLGKLHLTNLIKLEKERGDFELRAVCGADAKSFKESVRLNLGTVDLEGIDFSGCHFYDDYRSLIDNEDIDFILSTVPTYLHEEVAVYALNRGIHVFSEKPMALSIDSCQNMIDASEKNGKKLMIGQCLRFHPAYALLKEYVDNKTFGRVCRAEFIRYSQKPTWTWNNWILDPKLSGGCILDMHIHDVDLINWMFGMPDSLRSVADQHKLESVFSQYFYKDLFVTANADWSLPQKFPFRARCLLNFEEAAVVIEDEVLTVYKDSEVIVPDIPKETYFADEMRTFLEMVIDGKESSITSPESIADSVRIVMAEIESAQQDRKIIFNK